MKEIVFQVARPQRIGEGIAPIGSEQAALDQILRDFLKIVGAPVVAVNGIVAFEDPIVPRDPGAVKGDAHHSFLGDIHRGIDAQLPLQFCEIGR